ncbi:MAG: hypothetical protein JW797_06535 [Bradymonadales bacterium]|nr:hypothetical protein [Bradymonadales bacterium]
MRLKEQITERTAAATNVLLGIVLLGSSVVLATMGGSSYSTTNWCISYALVGLGTLLATAGHGLEMRASTYRLVWRLIFLLVGTGIGMFGVACLSDLWGQDVGRSAIPWVLAGSLVFILWSSLDRKLPFFPLTLLSALVLLFGLPSYVYLMCQGTLPGAGHRLAGMAILGVSALVQAKRSVSFKLIWPFDHNGVYHLLNTVAHLLVLRGVVLSVVQMD